MRDDGLRAVPDPGPLMLGDRMAGVPGSVVVPVLQGRRPLLVEVQALLGPGGVGLVAAAGAGSRRGAGQPPHGRARLPDRGRVPATAEFFVAAAGGITSPSRRPTWLSRWRWRRSSPAGRVPPDLVAFGELGLAGEVRMVPGADSRLAEAHRAGFTSALVPASTDDGRRCTPPPGGMVVQGVRTLAEALARAGSEARNADGPGTMPGWSTVPAAASR